MKQIFESKANGWDEVSERVSIYEFESDGEYWEFEEMTHDERCMLFDVFDESGYEITPGALFHTYSFDYSTHHIVMYERIAYNV